MPEPAELLASIALLAVTALAVGWPLLRRSRSSAAADVADVEALRLRHALALDALRDVELDRRAGSLDEAAYPAAREEAEAHAAATLAALEKAGSAATAPAAPEAGRTPRRALAGLGLALLVVVGAGFAVPPPIGLANRVIDPRADRIADALARFEANSSDPQAISDLADAYLAGDSGADLQRAAAALLLLVNLQPDNASAYSRLATAYLRAGDVANARATLDQLAQVEPDSPDLPFLRGLAARQEGDAEGAREQFERFVMVAPDDPRVPMVRALLDELSASPQPSAAP